MNDVNQTKQPNIFLITALSFHMCFSWTLLWKFHFFFNWPLEFLGSSIPLGFPCLFHPCHLFGLEFFWNSPVLLVCIHIVLGSHLKQVTAVLFSLSRAGSHIQNSKYWDVTFLTFVFQVGNSYKIYRKWRISMCFNSSRTRQKLLK